MKISGLCCARGQLQSSKHSLLAFKIYEAVVDDAISLKNLCPKCSEAEQRLPCNDSKSLILLVSVCFFWSRICDFASQAA